MRYVFPGATALVIVSTYERLSKKAVLVWSRAWLAPAAASTRRREPRTWDCRDVR
jgi:hypothetical protein